MADCRSCGAPLTWAKTYKTDSPIPLDPDPEPDGTLLLLPETEKVVHLTKKEAEWMRSHGVDLHKSHFATCPNADQHRRKR